MFRTVLSLILAVVLTFAGATRDVLYVCSMSETAAMSCCCDDGTAAGTAASGCCELELVEAEPASTPSIVQVPVPAAPIGPTPVGATIPAAPRAKAVPLTVANGPRGPPQAASDPIYLRHRALLI